ncbi:hypothetical protein LI142_17165 [Eubacterium limosum]|uniref:Uncharacterized protein n=1 Tax=Eubacterium limosum TaxID=1736 RepID=A0ABT5URD1_EUBLI|nr:hypothetical protein [Eubacterium limosum]MCB6571231.1 hypothetical protein [Eubacterium limosum]MDE1471340.1 hypothetical protein [Eubacterium limosum]
MKNELIDRYVYAVTRRLPARLRNDIDKELHSLIEDMLDARCGGLMPEDRDVRVILTELGTPSELAMRYIPEGRDHLIGPAYYSQYKMVTGIVLASVTFGLVLSGFISFFTDSSEALYFTLFSWIGTLITGLIAAFGAVTFIFAVFERKNIALNFGGSELDSLPPVPEKKSVIPKGEPIAGIIFSVIFCVIFLAAPQIICAKFGADQPFIPVFNVDLIHQLWYIFVALTILGIARESFKLYEGRYTKRLAIVTVVSDILSAALTLVLLSSQQILNSAFIAGASPILSNEVITGILTYFNLFFMAVILFCLLLDMGVTLFKGFWYNR